MRKMLRRTFRVEVVSPDRVVFESDNIVSLVAPGAEGSFGIMAHHAPIIAALQAGVLKLRDAHDREIYIAVSSGFLEASNNRVTVLCDTAELGDEIDVERAQRALERAQSRLSKFGDRGIDRERAQRAKERAIARLKAAGAYRRGTPAQT